RFGVSAVTAHKIIERLQREGLISSKPYRALFLTSKGARLAHKSRERHEIVYRVLQKLGVPKEVAQVDAEGIEHHVSPATLTVFQRFLRKEKT
ncbi:MAG: transcriptional regulator MntR, partial [Deltaproteobacteria bacterium]|nr:transcriptional regulator MntR [Deltaproteobacteria bacterium]